MAARKKAPPPAPEPEPIAPRPGMPVRLLAHDWPFLYSVLANGDLVMNQRLPVPARRTRKSASSEDDEALM